jgi:hypothetical protein
MWKLLNVMRPADAERAVSDALSVRFESLRMSVALPHLTRPWSADFADHYLSSYDGLSNLTLQQTEVRWSVLNNWAASFRVAALAIPFGRIPTAIAMLNQLLDSYAGNEADVQWERWKQSLRQYTETLRMRQRIYEEIHA